MARMNLLVPMLGTHRENAVWAASYPGLLSCLGAMQIADSIGNTLESCATDLSGHPYKHSMSVKLGCIRA